MCGIVASLGKEQSLQFILDGLETLEYRGYDSAGLAILNENEVKLAKVVGDVGKLVEKTKNQDLAGQIGIGHTRWATHGEVLVKNTHPHSDFHKDFFIVHNGIIENFNILKDFLTDKGVKFSSQTDSEVVAQLIAYHYRTTQNVRQAIIASLQALQGAYALAIISKKEPDKMWGAKLSSPLVLGISGQAGQFYLASDTAALTGRSNQIVILEDNELVEISRAGYKIINILKNKPIEKQAETLELIRQENDLAGFDDFMSKEIHQSPQTIINATMGRLNFKRKLIQLGGLDLVSGQLQHIDRIIIIACGTSYYAGLVGEYLLEEIADIPVEVQLASEFRYRKEPLSRSTAVIFISQSGETADSIACLNKIKNTGILKLGIVNVVGSTISRLTDAGVYCRAGPELSVASTKAFISQITILTLIALYLGKNYADYTKVLKALTEAPGQIENFLKTNQIEKTARKYAKYRNFIFLGRRYSYPVALEAALKLKEISYIHAEGISLGEIKHGPLALIDDKMPSFVFALSNGIYSKTCSNMAEIKTRKGRIIAVVDDPEGEAGKLADDTILVPKTIEQLQPLVGGVCCHLFAYHVARTLGRPIDRPRNLAKSVTVE